MTENTIIICPHCEEFVSIEKVNCGIFRHGVWKKNRKQINPHCPKDLCDLYYNKKLIFGCGKPFRIVKSIENQWIAEICDYI